MARPSKYDEQVKPYLDDIRKWTAAGATVGEIADALGISDRTLRGYAKNISAVSSALSRGRKAVKINIQAAMYKKALGFSYEEKRQSIRNEPDKDGNPRKVMYTEVYTRYCPPSEAAAAMMLRNIDPKYRDTDEATAKLKAADLRAKELAAMNAGAGDTGPVTILVQYDYDADNN